MNLSILGSNSKGNGYILHNEKEALIIEAGCLPGLAAIALNFDRNKIQGCLISHEHQDHAKHASLYIERGIRVAASAGTIKAIKKPFEKYTTLRTGDPETFGGFTVLPFAITHDAAEPLGFVIQHRDIGILVFATDTQALPYDFGKVDTYMIEANYAKSILDRNVLRGKVNYQLGERTEANHMSLESCAEFLLQQDLTETTRIVLLHLSDTNSDSEAFSRYIIKRTGIPNINIAESGMTIPVSKKPF